MLPTDPTTPTLPALTRTTLQVSIPTSAPIAGAGTMGEGIIKRLRDKNFHTWMGGYLRHLVERTAAPRPRGLRHLMFALCDHFEPLVGKPADGVGDRRVEAWEIGYPKLAKGLRDADGCPPRHSFFFPGEEYAPSYLERLATLVGSGFGEVEVHLHHDRDTADTLRSSLVGYLETFAGHGHLSRDADGNVVYAFIHGNWCLANSRSDGAWCGVDEEIPLLFETGCYADFTFPSAPSETQPGIVNQIYWPTGDLTRSRAYERGEPAQVGRRHSDRLLMIQGPLGLARKNRLSVRVENGSLTGHDPPTIERARTWVKQSIHVHGRPEWVFVKVHTHGAPEATAEALLGGPGRRFHQALSAEYNDGHQWALHYVTAREMFNIACAAMDGKTGNPGAYRDYMIAPPPAAT